MQYTRLQAATVPQISLSVRWCQVGGFFHCHRVGTADCIFELEKDCTGTPGIDPSPGADKKEGRPSPQQLTGMTDETLQRLTPDKCRCVCDKHPCCKKDQYVLNNVELRGNTFTNVGRWEDSVRSAQTPGLRWLGVQRSEGVRAQEW